MSDATQKAIELFIERRMGTLNSFSISWFGGEPLVASDIVLRISEFALAQAKSHGVSFNGGLTTNGYLLTHELFHRLLSCNQNFFQITLDGWRDVHDSVRKFANGRGSFDKIWSNILMMKQSDEDFDALLRIHVRRENIDELPVLMRKLGEAIGQDKRFRLDFEHIRNLGGEGGARLRNLVGINELHTIERGLRSTFLSASGLESDAELAATMDEELDLLQAKSMGESAGSRRASEIEQGAPYICYASKANSLLVRADGRIGKCTVALYDDRNTVGKINDDGTLSIDAARVSPWLRGLSSSDLGALACPYKDLPRATPQ